MPDEESAEECYADDNEQENAVGEIPCHMHQAETRVYHLYTLVVDSGPGTQDVYEPPSPANGFRAEPF